MSTVPKGEGTRLLRGRLHGAAGEVLDGLGDEEAEPAVVGVEAVGRQDEEDARDSPAEILEAEVGAVHGGGDAGPIEEVGVALGGGEDAGGFTVGLAELAVGSAGDQAAGFRGNGHVGEDGLEAGRG